MWRAGELETFGSGLNRPECVVGTEHGDVYVPDWRGGVTCLRADKSQETWLARDAPFALRPNGIALTPDGAFLIANLGDEGGVWRLTTDGELSPVLVELDGRPLPPANFVYLDDEERLWITVSTRLTPRQQAWRPSVGDGFVVQMDHRGAQIVADGLHYTNEARVDPSGRWLYVVETFARRLSRFPLDARRALGGAEHVATFTADFFPDGFAFDAEGGIWVTSLLSNQVLHLRHDGSRQVMLDERAGDHVETVRRLFDADAMPADALRPIPDTRLQHVTSIAFGGHDRRTVWLGCLHSDTIFRAHSDVPGAPAPHWSYSRLP